MPTPLREVASLRAIEPAPTASVAIAATVIAVPTAIAKVAVTPTQNIPCDKANTRTRIAPEHGRNRREVGVARVYRRCHHHDGEHDPGAAHGPPNPRAPEAEPAGDEHGDGDETESEQKRRIDDRKILQHR